jgi:putative colanic acid biosynthesis UDP-glucose lipid carrier transferase
VSPPESQTRRQIGASIPSLPRDSHHLDYPFFSGLLYNIVDLAAVATGGALAYQLTEDAAVGTPGKLAILLGLFITRVSFANWGLYDSWRGRSLIEQTGRLAAGWVSVFIALIILGFVFDLAQLFKRDWILMWFMLGGLFLIAARSAATLSLRLLRQRGWNHKRIAVVGTGDWAQTVIRRLNNAVWLGLDVVAIVDHKGDHSAGEVLDGTPVVGGLERLPALLSKGQVDEVWLCVPADGGGRVEEIERVQHLLRHSTVTQRFVPHFAEMRLMNRPMTQIMGLPVVNLSVSPMRVSVNRMVKAIEDRLIAALVLLVTSPLMLLIAIGVKLSSKGPVVFKQLRHGWDGKPIKVYKFRTMRLHEDETELRQATRDDRRVTPIGAFLRRTSLDELPQFYNVLQGRMSIVGPRPHAIEHNHYYMDQIDSYMQRHKVKPGITGWAQVNGYRGETDTLDKMERRVEHDLYYIENWSLWLDAKIIVLTIVRGFVHPNAY